MRFSFCWKEIIDVFLRTLDEWVYIDLYMGLYTCAQYTPTPPRQSELPAQRCSRLDNKKANTLPQSELLAQRCSRLDKKRVQIEYKGQIPPQPQLATGYVEAGSKLREGRGGQPLGEDVSKLGGSRDMEYPNIADGDSVAHEV